MSGMLDVPRFKVSPVPLRYLIPRIALLIFLGLMLYLGIYVNYYLLSESIPILTNWLFMACIGILLILQIILSYVRHGQYYYTFYEKHLEISETKRNSISYDSISDISLHENLLDRWFKTSTILMILDDASKAKKIKICNVTMGNQIYFFLQKMMHDSK